MTTQLNPVALNEGDQITVTDPATDETVCEGAVSHVDARWFRVQPDDGSRRRHFDFVPAEGMVEAANTANRYDAEVAA